MANWRNIAARAARAASTAIGFEAAHTLGTGGYTITGTGRRSWGIVPSSISAQRLVEFEAPKLVRASRELHRKNGWVSNARKAHVAGIIGKGIMPSPRGDVNWRKLVLDLWPQFMDQVDAAGEVSGIGLQELVAGGRFEAGEIFARFRPRRPSDNLAVPLQVQLIEPEQLDWAYSETRPSGVRIRSGIELSPVGARNVYHFWKDHPGDGIGTGPRLPVPAAEIAHVFRPSRPGQLRGLPELATVLSTLYELEEITDAQVLRLKIASMFVGFITKPADTDPIGSGSGGEDAAGRPLASLEPGTLQELGMGETMDFSDPPKVSGEEKFIRGLLLMVAGNAGLTYAQLTGDLAGVNFTSLRAGLIEVRRRMEQIQGQCLIWQYCRPLYSRFIEQAMFANALPVPIDFAANARLYMTADWQPPGWEFVQPLDDIRAIILKIRGGIMSREQAVALTGYDVEHIDELIKRDNDRADELGLVLDTDPRVLSQAGQAQVNAQLGLDAPSADDEAKRKGAGTDDDTDADADAAAA